MKRSNSFFLLSFLILILFAAGCSKNDSGPSSPTNNPGNSTPPAVPTVSFRGPASTAQNPSLFLINGYIQAMNILTNYSNMFANVQATFDNGVWTRKFLNGTITALLTTTQLSNGTYSWKLTFNGTSDSASYVNWLALEGTSSADGKTGTWKLYANNTNLLQGEYTWQRNDDGSLAGTIRQYNNGTEQTRIEAKNNSDNSGQVTVYSKNNLSYKAIWQSDGTGQWWQYDSTGSIVHQGTWS